MVTKLFTKHLNDCEKIIANDGCYLKELLHPKNDPVELPYSFSVAAVAVGESTYHHYLKQTEVYFILEGKGLLHVGTETSNLIKGGSAIVPPHKEQWLENTGSSELEFIVIVSPPWCEEDDIRT
ncbi:MAG: cupin domain-containing protein [Gammaproteobacteria bacterium]